LTAGIACRDQSIYLQFGAVFLDAGVTPIHFRPAAALPLSGGKTPESPPAPDDNRT
jgi:hypothetical protein